MGIGLRFWRLLRAVSADRAARERPPAARFARGADALPALKRAVQADRAARVIRWLVSLLLCGAGAIIVSHDPADAPWILLVLSIPCVVGLSFVHSSPSLSLNEEGQLVIQGAGLRRRVPLEGVRVAVSRARSATRYWVSVGELSDGEATFVVFGPPMRSAGAE